MDYLESQAHKDCMVRLEEMVYLETLAQLDSPGHLGNQATRRELPGTQGEKGTCDCGI